MDSCKPIHTLVLDAGVIIKNEPSASTLLNSAESLVTAPAIISEIKDAATRQRVETNLTPFLTLRTPAPASVHFVTEFARRTGDLAVLSRPDIQIIAITYEIECERNGGDWRLRRVPGQKGLNGAPPQRALQSEQVVTANADSAPNFTEKGAPKQPIDGSSVRSSSADDGHEQPQGHSSTDDSVIEVTESAAQLCFDGEQQARQPSPPESLAHGGATAGHDDSDSDSWITPSNLKKKQAQDASSSVVQTPEPKTMQVAVLTSDFAMQNVILQINLNLLSPSLSRVKHLKTYVLRCHACFQVCKEMTKQFCPRCGGATLTRVSTSTNANGEFKLHLKKNMQWNTRGDRYSVPKPVHGSASGRVEGGGKGGWGNGLILTEDQKEYQRAKTQEKKTKARDLMDEDYLPGILTGDRRREGPKIRIGAGRNVNSKKR